MAKNENDKFVKERILDISEELFSRQGYHAVSVRQITSAAKCNLAAVNYHFGNKKNLYLEVFRSRWIPRAQILHDSFLKHLSLQGFTSAKDVLHAFIEAFIECFTKFFTIALYQVRLRCGERGGCRSGSETLSRRRWGKAPDLMSPASRLRGGEGSPSISFKRRRLHKSYWRRAAAGRPAMA